MTGAWVRDDGGREAAGFRGSAGDCVTRAIAIATGIPYRQTYDDLFALQRAVQSRKRKASGSASPRRGVLRDAYEPYLLALGWVWLPKMSIGSGTTVHLRAEELPEGTIIARCSRHLCAVIGGIVHDTHDPSRGGSRAVYGWYEPGANATVRNPTHEGAQP